MVKKIINYIYVLAFLALILVPLYFTNTKPYSVSEIDNRKLAEAPEFGQEDFHSQFETYLKDRIGFRSEMINSYNVLNDVVADELTHPLYTYGKDGYVFFNMTPNLSYDEYHKAFAEFVKKMQDYCESRGVSFYFAFEPEKSSVLRDYLPEGVNYDDSWADQMLSYMESMGVPVINNKSYLIEKSKTEQVFNVQYDAGHWNELGCFYGTSNIFRFIHEDYPEVTELSMDEYEVSTTIAQNLPVSQFEVNETVPVFDRIDSCLDKSRKYYKGLELDPSHHHFHYFINAAENSESLPKMMIFQGSYYNSRPQFLIARTSEDIGIHNYQNVFNLDYYINAFDPDIVLFEVTEYTLTESYFRAADLLDPGWNPPLIDSRSEETEMMQIVDVTSSSEPLYERDLFELYYDGLKKVYLYDDDLRAMEYMYLIVGDRVLDLQKDESGFYSTMVSADLDLTYASLVGVTYDGEKYTGSVNLRDAGFLHDLKIEFSQGSQKIPDPSVYTAELGTLTDPYEFKTEVKGNKFNSLVVQLMDTDAAYINTLHTSTEEEKVSEVFLCQLPTGWYRFRMKANSNLKDEIVDYFVFLEAGEYYTYSYQVNKLSEKSIIYSSFEISGPGNHAPVQKDMISDLILSESASVSEDKTITLMTSTEGNSFNYVVMQVFGVIPEHGFAAPFKASSTGEYHGYYSHNMVSANYIVVLKGNSNKKDEFIEFESELKQGALYEYSFKIEKITETEIVISDFSFEQIST